MVFDHRSVSSTTQLELYQAMLTSRMIEEKMLVLLRQGKISKWFSGIGQEAIAVGVTSALDMDEYILPMHRNLGVFTTRKIPLYRLFGQWQGKDIGFTKGRDRSFHFGTHEHHIIGMISHLGPQLGVADGIALGNLLKKQPKVCAVFSGEGGTSEGDFHEALNIASVWSLPVLFCVENNGYGLSTPIIEQFNCEHIADKAQGYGMESHIIDGNNILEVYSKVSALAKSVRENPRPVLLEFKTFRIRGHEEASGTKYVPKTLLDSWKGKDPIINYENFLIDKSIVSVPQTNDIKERIGIEIEKNLRKAFDAHDIESTVEKEIQDLYKEHRPNQVLPGKETENMRLVDAVSDGLKEAMRRFEHLVIMGQDIAEYGGVFKVTQGFVEEFSKDRVRNTPICESGIVSTAMGLAIQNFKAVVEMQFADFVSSGFNPIVNYLAKSHYRWGQHADVVIRMPCGAGVGAGPFHSQTNEAWFLKTPGLKVIYPAFPTDAKGLLISAIEDPNPVLFFEHKALYRTQYQDVPLGYYNTPIGEAVQVRSGTNVSIVTYGAGVHWAIDLIIELEIDVDLIDLRTLMPLDQQTIYNSVKKTGKLLILHEDSLFCGLASEISALVAQHCFEYLDAPIIRVGSIETPIPFAKSLENNYLPKTRFREELLKLIEY
ncbi:pyruvate dehydrogenase [Galbibacter marinus]|uniref:Pyruvate dehydrogenase n=1 Tax=Galbibacter marinus TaxID=555500 RepID=K2P1E1_9FLAO|nr:dehydrogenase E1 component subunit alpha/beta [Galbibacter marinus]EKF54793.1 pyruvate dehydrogenase [Galbibacter marinus]